MALSEPRTDAPRRSPDHGFHPLRVARIVPETADAATFVLEVPGELHAAFSYEAGQFCTFRLRVDGELLLRSYSMSSSPVTDADLQVTVKRTPGGRVSNHLLDHVTEGDLLEATLPAGVFCLGPEEREVVAFSAGSGITPVLSLLKTALAASGRRARLFYANRDRDAVIFQAALDDLAARFGERFSVTHHLDADRGLVQPAAIEQFVGTTVLAEADHFVCGPSPFMAIVETALRGRGVAPDRIHIERFTPLDLLELPDLPQVPDPAPTSGAADATAPPVTTVTIELDGKADTAAHRPGTTILQTARQMGMAPPFSCEAGNCATCMARLVAGSATMHVNNALTDDEVAEGWVLTCQAVPTSLSVHAVYSYEEG